MAFDTQTTRLTVVYAYAVNADTMVLFLAAIEDLRGNCLDEGLCFEKISLPTLGVIYIKPCDEPEDSQAL